MPVADRGLSAQLAGSLSQALETASELARALADTSADLSQPKWLKNQVRYQQHDPDEPNERCANCRYFLPRGSACELVSGRILPDDVCDRFSSSVTHQKMATPRVSA